MATTFIALSSMSGIVCASDTNHTIYQLSHHQPLAVAVNSHSSIPWDSIINAYKRTGEPECKKTFEEYALEFVHMFPKLKDVTLHDLPTEDRDIIFMGYGKDDLFPTICYLVLTTNGPQNQIEIEEKRLVQISHQNPASLDILGNLESVSTILYGSTRKTIDLLQNKHLEQFEVYKQRVIEKFKGTEYENFVKQKLADYDPKEDFKALINEASDNTFAEVKHGINSFSIEEMVDATETIIDAEVRLDHLSSGRLGPLHCTKEIAVITRVEGLTWIKHSLYAL